MIIIPGWVGRMDRSPTPSSLESPPVIDATKNLNEQGRIIRYFRRRTDNNRLRLLRLELRNHLMMGGEPPQLSIENRIAWRAFFRWFRTRG